jgi:hypothetical protein
VQVETLGFQHLELEVTVPRVVIFRDAIIDLMNAELGDSFTERAQIGWATVLNYVGGAFIFVRVKYTGRLKILASSWAQANNKNFLENTEEDGEGEDGSKGSSSGEKIEKRGDSKKRSSPSSESGESMSSFMNTSVPTTYNEMFSFNAAVMDFGASAWMNEVLTSFDTIVKNISNSYRLQEECDVLSLRIAKYRMKIDLSEYRTVMLASLRSLVPKDWNSEHEVAWHWLWDNVERMLKAQMGKPRQQEKALKKLLTSLDEDSRNYLRREAYAKFFALAPAGQDYFKQSTTRLHFIADRVMAMTLEIFHQPEQMVDDLSAIGLRHVGYGVLTDFFGPYVTACVQVVRELADDDEAEEAFRWSMNLISRILCRVISEGSTIVMKAINQNSGQRLKKAVSCAPRGKRATWVLNIQVGTQSISPLMWAVETGHTDAAKAILTDLLTIRADRDQYYYGVDMLFERHPDVIKRLCIDAPWLLATLFDGLVWRSRTTEAGKRRVNYYVQHLIIGQDGKFAKAIEWITDTSDPKIVCHPVVTMVMDTVWGCVAFRSFLLNKLWTVFALVVFLLGTSGTKHFDARSEVDRAVVFGCRCFIYTCILSQQIWHHARDLICDIRAHNFTFLRSIPVPTYLTSSQELASLLLTVCMMLMLCVEPILHCLPHSEGDFEGAGLFTQTCPQAEDVIDSFSVFSVLAVLLNFGLILDLTVFSTRVSALLLASIRVLSEMALFLIGFGFCTITFASAACALHQNNPDFNGITVAGMSFVRIALGMYSNAAHYDDLMEDPALFLVVVLYIIVTLVFLFNLLIAQLNCAYLASFEDMVGYARLNRGKFIVEAMTDIAEKRWWQFVDSLNFEQKCEFGEGDIGLAGAIQTVEPAGANPTSEDTIRRFGGSTSPAAQWPEEKDAADDEADRLERMEKRLAKAIKRLGGGRSHGSALGTSFSGTSGLHSIGSSGHSSLGSEASQ